MSNSTCFVKLLTSETLMAIFHKFLDPKDSVSIWMVIMVLMAIVSVCILVFFCCCLMCFKCIRYCQRRQRNSKKKPSLRFHSSIQKMYDAALTVRELETKELGNLQGPQLTAASHEKISSSENKEATVVAIETAQMMVDALNPKINARPGHKKLANKRVSYSENEEIALATIHPCPIHSEASKLGVRPQRSQWGGSPSRVKKHISKFEGKKAMG